MMRKAGLDVWGNPQRQIKVDHATQLALHRQYRRLGPGWREAWERLVCSLTGIVQALARCYAMNCGVSADDLLQDGLEDGLLPAIERFDETKGVKISTYVYGVVNRVVAKQAQRYARQRQELVLRRGAEATEEGAVQVFPLSAGTADAEQKETEARLRAALRRALTGLTKTEQWVLRRKYGLVVGGKPETDREIAAALGKHRSRVSQIAEAARRKLLADEELRRIAGELGYDN